MGVYFLGPFKQYAYNNKPGFIDFGILGDSFDHSAQIDRTNVFKLWMFLFWET